MSRRSRRVHPLLWLSILPGRWEQALEAVDSLDKLPTDFIYFPREEILSKVVLTTSGEHFFLRTNTPSL